MKKKSRRLPFVSVVIPIYSDSGKIEVCLSALNKQTYPKNKFEIVIVDNGDNSNLKKRINPFQNIIVVKEKRPGMHLARNKGISFSKGKVLAFTDSDCIPENVWIEKGVKKITNIPNCGLVAGRINVFPENTRKPNSVELFDIMTAFSQKKYVENIHFGATANLFTLKEVIENVGYFDATLKSGADLKWGQKVYNAGYKIVYSKEACIAHPARNSLRSLLRKHARVAGGLYDMHRGNYPLEEFLIDLKDDWPHYQDFKSVFCDRRLTNGIQKLQIFGIMLLVKFTRVAERIKLKLGAKSKRI